MMRNKGNLVSATCLAVFGVYVISVASKLAYVSEVGPGPGFFPLWLGIGLVSFAACLIFAALASHVNQDKADPITWKTTGRALAGWLALMLIRYSFAALLPRRQSMMSVRLAERSSATRPSIRRTIM